LNEDLACSKGNLEFSTSKYLKLNSFIIQLLYSEFFYTFPNKQQMFQQQKLHKLVMKHNS